MDEVNAAMSKVSHVGDLEVLWELFERTGSVEVYLLFHQAKKNAQQFERAKHDIDAMKRELERR